MTAPSSEADKPSRLGKIAFNVVSGFFFLGPFFFYPVLSLYLDYQGQVVERRDAGVVLRVDTDWREAGRVQPGVISRGGPTWLVETDKAYYLLHGALVIEKGARVVLTRTRSGVWRLCTQSEKACAATADVDASHPGGGKP